MSGMGQGSDASDFEAEIGTTGGENVNDVNKCHQPTIDEEECTIVQSMSFNAFRSKLVEHFHILFHQRKIVRPLQTRSVQPDI